MGGGQEPPDENPELLENKIMTPDIPKFCEQCGSRMVCGHKKPAWSHIDPQTGEGTKKVEYTCRCEKLTNLFGRLGFMGYHDDYVVVEDPALKHRYIGTRTAAGEVADFILARDLNMANSPQLESTAAQPSNDYKVPPPLDTEELEKQIKEVLTNWSSGEFPEMNVVAELLALLAQHTQVAVRAELIGVQKELNKAEVAGPVKWYVEDRLEQLEQRKKEE